MSLCVLYPDWSCAFQASMAVDFAGHWAHMHAAAMQVEISKCKKRQFP